MRPTYEELLKIIEELQAALAAANKRIAELEEQLKLNSRNSSKPPSLDRKASKNSLKQGGAQKGHLGYFRQKAKPTHIHEHKPSLCPRCGSEEITLSKPWVFQQVEIPKPVPVVTEYQCYGCRCKVCGERQAPSLPTGVEYSAFGPNLAARIGLLTTKFRLSKRQTLALIKQDCGIELSVGSVSNIEARLSTALETPHEAIRSSIIHGREVVYIDETGMREQAQNHYLWIMSTASAVYLTIQPGRSRQQLSGLLPFNTRLEAVTDRYGVYNFIRHQWCWAHLVRDIRRFSERDGPDREIGKALLFEAKDMLRTHALFRSKKLDRDSAYSSIAYRRKRIMDLLFEAIATGSKLFHRFAKKCLNNSRKLWRFARLHGLEPTNNRAERDLRPLVIWRKTSFGTRSIRGSQYLTRSMSIIATLERTRRDVLGFFEAAYRSRFDHRITSSMLTICS